MIFPDVVDGDPVADAIEELAGGFYVEGELSDAPPSDLAEVVAGAVGREPTPLELERAELFWRVHVWEHAQGVGLGWWRFASEWMRRRIAAGSKSFSKGVREQFAAYASEVGEPGWPIPVGEKDWPFLKAEWRRLKKEIGPEAGRTVRVGEAARRLAHAHGPGQTQDEFVPPAARQAVARELGELSALELAQFCAVYREQLARLTTADEPEPEPDEPELVEAPEGWRELGRRGREVAIALDDLERERKAVVAALNERKATLVKSQARISRALGVMARGPYLVERSWSGAIVVVHGDDGDRVELVPPPGDADGRQTTIPGCEPEKGTEDDEGDDQGLGDFGAGTGAGGAGCSGRGTGMHAEAEGRRENRAQGGGRNV